MVSDMDVWPAHRQSDDRSAREPQERNKHTTPKNADARTNALVVEHPLDEVQEGAVVVVGVPRLPRAPAIGPADAHADHVLKMCWGFGG